MSIIDKYIYIRDNKASGNDEEIGLNLLKALIKYSEENKAEILPEVLQLAFNMSDEEIEMIKK